MKVRQLINELLDMHMDAEVRVVTRDEGDEVISDEWTVDDVVETVAHAGGRSAVIVKIELG